MCKLVKGDVIIMNSLEKFSNFVSKYMAVFVIVVAAIALYEPTTFKWSAPYITILLGIVMFGMGMTLKISDFKLVFQRPKDVMVGALAQFTIMPFLAWMLAHAFGLPAYECRYWLGYGFCQAGYHRLCVLRGICFLAFGFGGQTLYCQ